MVSRNLFTMLSAYRPGTAATPFENYCTSGLAYLLSRGHRMLGALIADAASTSGEPVAMVEVQARMSGAGVADLVVTFEGGRRAVVEVQVEPGADRSHLASLEEHATSWGERPAFVLLGLEAGAAELPWKPLTWMQVVEALDDDPDPLVCEYVEFVLRDILGLGDVPLEEAITTNRLYALGGAALRRRFGDRVRYENSASRPLGGRYRYLGTTFALDGGPMEYWIGLVNEEVPLSEHYHLMLASKERGLEQAAAHPRATGDWSWKHWTGQGRVVRPVPPEAYDELLRRLNA